MGERINKKEVECGISEVKKSSPVIIVKMDNEKGKEEIMK